MHIAFTLLVFMGGFLAFMIIVIAFVKVFFPFFTKEELEKKRRVKLQQY